MESRDYSMEQIHKMLGTSRQGYHQQAARNHKALLQEIDIVSQVKDWRLAHPKMGSRQMYHSMLGQGIELKVGINKFEQLVSNYGLGVGVARKRGPLTTDGKGKGAYSNLTNGLVIRGINQLIVGDITYFDIKSTWHYVFTLKDVYSQYIVGLQAAETMEARQLLSVLKACEELRGSQSLKGCIHHSDNGSQYNSSIYVKELHRLKMRISRSDNCQQNGSAEQLNHIVKNMYLSQWSIGSLSELKQACREMQYLNNHERAIKQLGNRTPVGYEMYINTLTDERLPEKRMYNFNDYKV